MTIGKMYKICVDTIAVNEKITVDEVPCQNDSVDKMTDDEMSVDKMIAVRMTVIRQDDFRKYDGVHCH